MQHILYLIHGSDAEYVLYIGPAPGACTCNETKDGSAVVASRPIAAFVRTYNETLMSPQKLWARKPATHGNRKKASSRTRAGTGLTLSEEERQGNARKPSVRGTGAALQRLELTGEEADRMVTQALDCELPEPEPFVRLLVFLYDLHLQGRGPELADSLHGLMAAAYNNSNAYSASFAEYLERIRMGQW